ncbi:MAG: WXG100 family type VII secretion target [Ruminococcaceae bacterium]|nr:WXG100 family type VII secretion target [Oscillospiraceae bacterium]
MALIQVTPELLDSKANELRTLRSQHDEIMNKMSTLISSLSDVWKGDAQQAFVDKYDEMKGTFSNFSDLLEEYAKMMNTAAQKLYDADQSIQVSMAGFGE